MALGKLFPHCMRNFFFKNCDPRDFSTNNNPRLCCIKTTGQSSLELPIPHVRHVPEVFESKPRQTRWRVVDECEQRDGEWWLNAR